MSFEVTKIQCGDCYHEAMEATCADISVYEEWWGLIISQYMELYAAIRNDLTIGRLAILKDVRDNPKEAHILSLFVSQESRRQGAATRLLTVADDVAIGWDARAITLAVVRSNTSAISLYTKAGYQVDANPKDKVLTMRKPLG